MIAVMAILGIALLVLGLPIWLVFLLTSVVVIYFFTSVPMLVVASTLFGALDNVVLLAVPGFIFAGTVMARGGMTTRLIRWIHSLVAPVPGGIALTTIGAGEVFGAISGSAPAATAALGKILYPALRDNGYPERFSLGLIASAGAIAIIIPPSIVMILYSAVTGAPVGTLFLAGFMPGLLLGLLVSGYCIYIFYRQRLAGGATWNLTEIWTSTRTAIWTLGLPAIIFGGIYGGFTTPTEAAVLASVYAVIISAFVYRELKWKGLWDVTVQSAQLTAKIFLITASAGLFSWVLTISQVPQSLVAFIESSGSPTWLILLMFNALLLLAGMFIDPTSNVLVLTPILWPVAQAIGVDIIHFGIIMTVNMAIGMFSPPFGLNLFVVCSIMGVSAGRLAASVAPFFLIYLLGLIFVTFFPSISLWLPSLLPQ